MWLCFAFKTDPMDNVMRNARHFSAFSCPIENQRLHLMSDLFSAGRRLAGARVLHTLYSRTPCLSIIGISYRLVGRVWQF